MKKIRSLNFNKNILSVAAVLSLGYFGANIVDKKIESIYKDRKPVLEKAIGNVLDKNIELGDYKGLGVLVLEYQNQKFLKMKI